MDRLIRKGGGEVRKYRASGLRRTFYVETAPQRAHVCTVAQERTTIGASVKWRHDPRPFRAVAHRLPARRRRPHRALQLALRAAARRRVRAAHRGHRRRAVVRRDGRGHPRRPALARPRLGRGAGRRRRRTGRTSSRSGSIATARWPSGSSPSGHAYYCYCTPDELKAKREAAEAGRGGAWRYDRTCCALTADEIAAREREQRPRAIRFRRRPSGPIALRRRSCTARSRSTARTSRTSSSCAPTAIRPITSRSCRDDVDMEITHVVRGDDHISNTPKQVLLVSRRSARRCRRLRTCR